MPQMVIVTGNKGLMAPQFSTDRTLDKAPQPADAERLFRDFSIIAPAIAQCNKFVLIQDKSGGARNVLRG